jgi:parallel beta-helix repeat protein
MASFLGPAVFGLSVVASISLAGPLDPPAGPVAPTAKPLGEVEPRVAINSTNTRGDADSLFKITQPGSYYLTGNITGVAGKHGIEVAASSVTIDLNGFDMVGVPGMGAFDGISVTLSEARNIEVRNGTVRGWGDEGVDLGTLAVDSAGIVKDVRATLNFGNGIAVGRACLITGCIAFANNGHGISAGTSTTISGCTTYDNTGDGISTSTGCTITACSSTFNSGSGISAGIGSTVSGCTAYGNINNGIVAASDSRIADNACDSNGAGSDFGAGILVTGSDNRIENNNCTDNDTGIDADSAGNFIAGNTCSGNTLNWDIVAGNVCFVVEAITSAAITGNAGGTSPGSTDPNANFSY